MNINEKKIFEQDFISENQQVIHTILEKKNIELCIKREDEIHPFVSGNKFRKLKYNIIEAKNQQKNTLLTFGGAFSNHIVATAVAGNLAGFKTIGIIRGDELAKNIEKTFAGNSSLQKAHQNGMEFKFVSREMYRNKTSEEFIQELKNEFGNFYLIPEGGTNILAIKGCEEILTEQDNKFDYICSAIGTGGTIAGLINSAENHQKIIGFPALKGDFLQQEIHELIKNNNINQNWTLEKNYHFGGYAKYNQELIRFINEFKTQTNIPLDPIYTGKMLYGILAMIKENYFEKNSRILAIHTGGLQGIAGINKKLKYQNKELIIL